MGVIESVDAAKHKQTTVIDTPSIDTITKEISFSPAFNIEKPLTTTELERFACNFPLRGVAEALRTIERQVSAWLGG